MTQLSVILPLLNEAENLLGLCQELAAQLERWPGPGQWRFVPVDNGSTDGTPAAIAELARLWPATVPVRLERRAIGLAFRAGWEAAPAPWVLLQPVDEFDPVFWAWAWREREQFDMLLGSKRADPTLNQQSLYRRLLSWGLNALLEGLCGSVLADTHGPKLVRGELRELAAACRMERGLFDTELALRAWRRGCRLVEAPVRYRERRASRDPMVRKIARNVTDLVRLSRALRHEPCQEPRYRRVARCDLDPNPAPHPNSRG